MSMRSVIRHPALQGTLAAAISVALAAPVLANAGDSADARTLDKVSVTASGYEQNLKDAPATITVITAEEIKKKSYTDITDALKNVPGIHIQGGGVEKAVMIRGMSADYTLFMIDGRPMQDNQAFATNGAQAGTPVNFLPPIESIERIEVLRGPASSLYGSDAIGGVINIITKKVVNTFSGSLSSEYLMAGSGNKTNNDSFQNSVAVNVPLVEDKLSLQVTGGFLSQDEADFVGGDDSAAADPEFKRRNVGGKLSWKLDERNAFTFAATHTEQERWHNPGRSLAADDDASYSRSLRDNFSITHDGDYENLKWWSYLTYDTSENPTRVNATTGVGIDFDSWSANTQATWFLEKHTLTAGANFKREELADGATNGVNIPGLVLSTDIVEMKRGQSAVFAEDNWQLTDDLSLLLSGRYDDNEKFGGQFSPKAYAVYQATDNLTIKGGYTTGYKAPSLRQSAPDFGGTSMGGVMIGNPELKPETSQNIELGLAYENEAAGFGTSLTAYRSEFEDKIMRTGRICAQNTACEYKGQLYPAHQYGYTAYENIDTAKLHGVEWTLDWSIADNLTWRHSYTYSKSEQTSGTYKGKPLNDLPEHMFNGTLDWQASDALNLWTQFNFRGETSGRYVSSSGSASNGVQYPAYSFFDAGMVYAATDRLRLKLGIYNIGNKEVTPEDGFAYVLEGRRYSAALSVDF